MLVTMTTQRIVFTGKVQGVGFRYTTRSFARRLPLAGFVRNLPDGTVELVAQGSDDSINELIGQLQRHFGEKIVDIRREHRAGPEEFAAFEIR